MSASTSLMLTGPQEHAVGALFGMALHHAHVRHTLPLPPDDQDHHRTTHPWTHHSSALLTPVFKFLQIDDGKWNELEEAAAKTPVEDHVGPYLTLLAKEPSDKSSEVANKQAALAETVDSMSSKMEKTDAEKESKRQKQGAYEKACREKFQNRDNEITSESKSEENNTTDKSQQENKNYTTDSSQQENKAATSVVEQFNTHNICESAGKPMEEATMLSYPRKVTVLYELVSACLANLPVDSENCAKRRKGYDARHRAALRVLATWFDVKWIKVEVIETLVAFSAMAILKEEESNEGDKSSDNSWESWKRGGIIGAAAVTGGALMAITGGLAAPAIAASFNALAPTVGAVIPVIGASGFAAVASVAGSVAGSVAVAASFGAAGAGLAGKKMANRIGDVDEFEFKTIGENHNQGLLAVEISVSGFIYEEEDFIRPWEGQHDNLERYALQWESKNLIALSYAIEDWLTSKVAKEAMKQGAMLAGLQTLMAAVAWPTALLSATDYIDSIWTIAVDRSDKAGILLAEALQRGLHGNRPVTLVGFSLGARVIFKCLQILAESEIDAGIVERVVLLGSPIPITDANWEATQKVVAGRYVNAYSTNDWMLGIAFRATLLASGLAGIQPVEVPGIENVDVTEIINGHSSYLWATQLIIEQLDLDGAYYPIFNHQMSTKN